MAIPLEGKLALRWVLQGAALALIPLLISFCESSYPVLAEWLNHSFYVVLVAFVAMNYAILFVVNRHRKLHQQIGMQAFFIGLVFGVGLMFSMRAFPQCAFGWYLCVLSFFHFSEYFSTSIYNYESLTVDSFLLNHSIAYGLAAVSSWCEFFVEAYFFPAIKQFWVLSIIGLILCVGGEVLRKVSMLTAGRSFNHYIQTTKAQDHRLVTNGVYAWSRHPSYVGWFYWSLGTQIILLNPICCIAYTVASWRFFNERIEDEEITLLNFFGEDYLEYQRKVRTGLPYIRGYKLQL